MDTTKLMVGQNVFMRSGEVGDWAVVVEATPTGVIVQSDPAYGDQLIRFDKNGIACDSSDIDVDGYKNLVLFDRGDTGFDPASCGQPTLPSIPALPCLGSIKSLASNLIQALLQSRLVTSFPCRANRSG
jgi:hypothetical protein